MKQALLPWAVEGQGTLGSVVDSKGNTVVQTQERNLTFEDCPSPGEKTIRRNADRVNVAHFVVKAVNNHDRLVRTCKDLLQALELKEGLRGKLNDGDRMRMADARAVLRDLEQP